MTVWKPKDPEAKAYLTRAQALEKLQCTPEDFRRLCILKGIHPRVPKRAKFKSDRVYYHLKDIYFLRSEPLLQKYEKNRATRKKMANRIARREKLEARVLRESLEPESLFHVIKERYPSFVQALADLDDSLCTLCLFATFPAANERQIKAEVITESRESLNYFYLLLSRLGAVEKVFISVKGFYIQVKLLGQLITWVIPHEYVVELPEEVDFALLNNFAEFGLAMLKTVNFKLYAMAGYEYPPTLKGTSDDSRFLSYDLVSKEEQEVSESLVCDSVESTRRRSLFRGLTFYCSCETNIYVLGLILMSCGATIGYDEPNSEEDHVSPVSVDSPSITHHVVDKPPAALAEFSEYSSTRVFIQPQWIFDSVNANQILPVAPYAPGKTPPPHMSPFGEALDDEGENAQAFNEVTEQFEELHRDSCAADEETVREVADTVQQLQLQSIQKEKQEPEHEEPLSSEKTNADDQVAKIKVKRLKKKGLLEMDRATTAMTAKQKRLYKTMTEEEQQRATQRKRGRTSIPVPAPIIKRER